MDEIRNVDDLDEYETKKDATRKSPRGSEAKTVKKCVRKGDKICIAKMENITMLERRSPKAIENMANKIQPNAHKSSLDEPIQNVDEVLSGESLYKAYTFEQSPNDEETEKCIAFWRSVMEKNLKPIKCTIIENNRNRQALQNVREETTIPDGKTEINSSTDDQKVNCEKIHAEYRKMWLRALKEIKRKKLHEVELIGLSRCKMCESLKPIEKEDSCATDKKTIKKEVEELNDWQPKSEGKGRFGSKLKNNQVPVDRHVSENKNVTRREESREEVGEKKSEENRNEKNAVRDSKQYKYRNVIEEKKKTGAYSDWRRNMLKPSCSCKNIACNCNTNPAVISVERIQTGSTLDTTEPELPHEKVPDKNSNDLDSTVQETLQPKILPGDPPGINDKDDNSRTQDIPLGTLFPADIPDKREPDTVSILSDVGRRGERDQRRSLSLLLRCPCGRSSCDCLDTIEYINRNLPLKYDEDPGTPPDNPKNPGILGRTSMISSGTRCSVQINEKVIMHEVSLYDLEGEEKVADNEIVDDAHTDSTDIPITPCTDEITHDESLNESLSKLDTIEIVPPGNEADTPGTMNEDRRKSLPRVDSVEIIRRRISSVIATGTMPRRDDSSI